MNGEFKGILRTYDGDYIIGKWGEDDCIVGKSKYIQRDGTTWEINQQNIDENGDINGEMLATQVDGSQKKGLWRNDEFEKWL